MIDYVMLILSVPMGATSTRARSFMCAVPKSKKILPVLIALLLNFVTCPQRKPNLVLVN